MDQFVPVLRGCMDGDNNLRTQAEAAYNQAMEQHPGETAKLLIEVLANYPREAEGALQVRNMAAILTRRLIDERGLAWSKIDPTTKTHIRQGLWHAFTEETDGQTLRALAHAIAKASEGWPDLLPGLLSNLQASSTSTDANRQLAVFFVLEQMAEYCEDLHTNPAQMLPVLQAAMSGDAVPLPTRTAALKTCLALLINLQMVADRASGGGPSKKGGKGSPLVPLQPLAVLVLASLARLLEKAEECDMGGEVKGVLELVSECVDHAPKFFQEQMEGMLQVMMAVGNKHAGAAAGGEEGDEEGRECLGFAVEIMLCCCEACPGTVRKMNGFAQAFLTMCMSMCAMSEFNSEEAWLALMKFEPEAEEAEELGVETCGESMASSAIYRLMGAVGGKTMLPIAMGLVPEWLGKGESWSHRRVSLVVVEALVDRCPKLIKPSFGQMLKTAVDFTKDAHPRVAAEALHLINILCTKFPELVPHTNTHTHLQQILPALGAVIVDENRPLRLRGIAVNTLAVVLSNDRIEVEALGALVDPLLSALISCLQPTMPAELQEITLDAVSAIATAAQEGFNAHYQMFMCGLKSILAANSVRATGRAGELRDKALKCVGVVGAAVGKGTFAPDAVEVMDMLCGQLQEGGGEVGGEVSFASLGEATATVCAALGEGFVRYLSVLVPLLGQAAAQEVEFSVVDVDDDVEEGCNLHADGTTLSTIVDVRGGVGKKCFTMNTYTIQEKIAALDTLDRYARVLGAAFVEPAEALFPVLEPALTYKFSEQVRTSAACCLGSSFDCYVEAVKAGTRTPTQATDLLFQFLPKLVDGFEKEGNSEGRNYFAEAMKDMLCACAESGGVCEETGVVKLPVVKLGNAECAVMAMKIRDGMITSLARRGEMERAYGEDEELEEEDYEELLEQVAEETELMSLLTDCTGYLIKAERAAFLPTFDKEYVPLLQALLGEQQPGMNNPATLTTNAIALFDDTIEYCGPAAHKYLQTFMVILDTALTRATPDANGNTHKQTTTPEQAEDDDEELAALRQACLYGIIQTCKHAPACLDKALEPFNLLPRLLHLLTSSWRNDDIHASSTENAVSALLSICQASLSLTQRLETPSKLVGKQNIPPLSDQIAFCLREMPLKEDVQEARVVHRLLADLLLASHTHAPTHAALFGTEKGFQNAGVLVAAVAGVVKEAKSQTERGEEKSALVCEPVVAQRLAELLQKLPGQMPGEVWGGAWGGVKEEVKVALQVIVGGAGAN